MLAGHPPAPWPLGSAASDAVWPLNWPGAPRLACAARSGSGTARRRTATIHAVSTSSPIRATIRDSSSRASRDAARERIGRAGHAAAASATPRRRRVLTEASGLATARSPVANWVSVSPPTSRPLVSSQPPALAPDRSFAEPAIRVSRRSSDEGLVEISAPALSGLARGGGARRVSGSVSSGTVQAQTRPRLVGTLRDG